LIAPIEYVPRGTKIGQVRILQTVKKKKKGWAPVKKGTLPPIFDGSDSMKITRCEPWSLYAKAEIN